MVYDQLETAIVVDQEMLPWELLAFTSASRVVEEENSIYAITLYNVPSPLMLLFYRHETLVVLNYGTPTNCLQFHVTAQITGSNILPRRKKIQQG